MKSLLPLTAFLSITALTSVADIPAPVLSQLREDVKSAMTARGTWRIDVVDVNHDGKPDFITNNVESNDISILLAQ